MPIYLKDLGWVLETPKLGYALGLDPNGLLVNRYWGARLPYLEDYPPPANPQAWASFSSAAHLASEEFPAYAGPKYIDSQGLVDIYVACSGVCVQRSYADYINYPRAVNAKEAVGSCLWSTVAVEKPGCGSF